MHFYSDFCHKFRYRKKKKLVISFQGWRNQGAGGRKPPLQILVDQLTLSQPRRTDYAPTFLLTP